METEVTVRNQQPLPAKRTRLIRAARKSLQAEQFSKPCEVCIVLTDDRDIRELNRDYRGIDRPTDVLSFSQLEGEQFGAEGEPVPLGDVVISVETAERQAREAGHSLDSEMDLLVVHGMLHLLGYDDQTEEGAADMRIREKAILDKL